MTLPLLISVPHCGRRIPDEVADRFLLGREEIIACGDEGAWEIYSPLRNEVAAFIHADVARVVVDLNRAEDDLGRDGVVKTHTCRDLPIYAAPLGKGKVKELLERHYRPYHRRLSAFAHAAVVLGVDCHTMPATGLPSDPDPGQIRPQVCIGTGNGSCPRDWALMLQTCFQAHFPGPVTLDQPYGGGHITMGHGQEMPWVQIELSCAPFADHAEKAMWVVESLTAWVEMAGYRGSSDPFGNRSRR